MKMAFLGIGSNLGNRENNMQQAVEHISKRVGEVYMTSAIYETEPWGFQSDDAFLNMVIAVETQMSPQVLLSEILYIESLLGRIRNKVHYSSRIIDIDILIYDDVILSEPDLTIPHSLLQERKFVLIPLCEIASQLVHPVLKKTFRELLDECGDRSNVTPLPPCPLPPCPPEGGVK
jgi:2-amino-4-hydroxy-6-hydroxymethyldihydropteridine diphosphokinase